MLASLPEELIQQIFENFVVWDGFSRGIDLEAQHTLCNVCRTRKQFNDSAQTILHRTFVKPCEDTLSESQGYLISRDVPHKDFQALSRFMETLKKRPDLRRAITTLRLDCWNRKSQEETSRSKLMHRHCPPEMLHFLRTYPAQVIDDTTPANHINVYVSLARACKNEYTLVCDLLRLAQRLERLHLSLPFRSRGVPDDFLFGKLLDHASLPPAGQVAPFGNLKFLSISFYLDFYRHEHHAQHNTHFVARMFHIPSLQTFRIIGLNDLRTREQLSSINIMPASSNIRKLELNDCCLSRTRFEAMIAACKRLEKFCLTSDITGSRACWRYVTDVLTDQVTWPDVRNALYAHRATLTSLELDLAGWRHVDTRQAYPMPLHMVFGDSSLKEFKVLASLWIQGHVLLLHAPPYEDLSGTSQGPVEEELAAQLGICLADVLPTSLQCLAIMDRHHEEMEDMPDRWDVCSEKLPNLTRLVLGRFQRRRTAFPLDLKAAHKLREHISQMITNYRKSGIVVEEIPRAELYARIPLDRV